MGAGFLTKYVGQKKDKCPFKSIVSLAAPYDMKIVIEGLSNPSNYLCKAHFLTGIKKVILNNYDLLLKFEEKIGYDLK